MGHFDSQRNILHLHPETTFESDEVLDLAAGQTFLQGGTVYAVAPEEVPGEPPTAIFRDQI